MIDFYNEYEPKYPCNFIKRNKTVCHCFYCFTSLLYLYVTFIVRPAFSNSTVARARKTWTRMLLGQRWNAFSRYSTTTSQSCIRTICTTCHIHVAYCLYHTIIYAWSPTKTRCPNKKVRSPKCENEKFQLLAYLTIKYGIIDTGIINIRDVNRVPVNRLRNL